MADGGSLAKTLAAPIEGYAKSAQFAKELAGKYYEGMKEDVSNLDWNAIRDIPSNIGADLLGLPGDLAKFAFPYGTGVYAKGIEDQPSKFGSRRIKDELKDVGITSGKDYPFIEGTAEVFPGTTIKAVKSIPTLGKALAKEGARQIQTGEGLIGRNVINPRQNIIKDPGGMVVGGENSLDNELRYIKKSEETYDQEPYTKAEPNAVALNNWIDTKVRKYLRNQAGTKDDPILKSIESGVEHNFIPPLTGDAKYSIATKREMAGKPKEGIAKTDLGKDWEYTVDSIFQPTKSKDVKRILNDPNIPEPIKKSKLRIENDLPIYNDENLESLKLLNEIPDENIYSFNSNFTHKLGLDHIKDVLYEDLQSGKLKPEQLSQMSIEKAVRRTAEYDAQKAKEMTKAHATSIEGFPVPKEYDDGFKWVELKHGTDKKKTAEALKSEGQMMGHCVGSYCPQVESGDTRIFSLRGPDGKSHVTIEAADHGDWMNLEQVKGKQNKRPDDKYQSYITDFIQKNPTSKEIVDIKELDNTNLMFVDEVASTGIVPKDIHFHPEVEKAIKTYEPNFDKLPASLREDYTYALIKGTAKDLAKQNNSYFTKDNFLNHIREKYLTQSKKKSGGSVTKYDLEKEFKLNNIIEIPRRKHG
jgi:hypothetical protein